jgi:AcrR family transcriptional regulator
LAAALKAFRRRGFERTTMRDIARAAKLSLGAAYHYFPSKEALVTAYYEWTQSEHERLASAALLSDRDLRERLRTLLATKLELLRNDRKLLGALFSHLGDPAHPLSVFGKQSKELRDRSLAQFEAVLDDPAVPPALRPLLGRGLWLAHLGVLLLFIHDDSPAQERTSRLVDLVVDLFASAAPLLSHPLAEPIRARLLGLVADFEPARGAS